MTGPEHYAEADRLLAEWADEKRGGKPYQYLVAQVHATLAQTAAIAMQGRGAEGSMPMTDHKAWLASSAHQQDPAPADSTPAAMDEIAELLRDPQWGVGMLEDIREIVERTGRSCENYPADKTTRVQTVSEVTKVEKPVIERGGYSAGELTVTELPPPPASVSVWPDNRSTWGRH